MYAPVNPNIKVGCKGVFITRTYYLDGLDFVYVKKFQICPHRYLLV